MRHRAAGVAGTAAALAAVLLTVACSGDEPATGDAADRPSGTATSRGGGTGEPTVVDPVRAPLDWRPTGGTAEERRTVGPEWTALVDARGRAATLTGPGAEVTVPAGAGRVVSEVLMDDAWAVVVVQDEQEQRPSVATAVDLADGSTHELGSPVPASGGSWSMHGGTVRYGTFRGRDYCVAEVDVASGTGQVAWCAARRQGFTRLTDGPHGAAMLTFDDARPVACRTPVLLDDSGEPRPVAEAAGCSAWDVAAMPGGAIWSEVANDRRMERGTFHAVADGTTYDLGPGTTGTLTPCGDSVWFVRDPQDRDDPAQLLRWTPAATLEVAYESESTGNAFLAAPECAGGVLTLSAFGEAGDAQVTAPAP